eukprot:360643-Chlamydomonas_euryale.AAC.7
MEGDARAGQRLPQRLLLRGLFGNLDMWPQQVKGKTVYWAIWGGGMQLPPAEWHVVVYLQNVKRMRPYIGQALSGNLTIVSNMFAKHCARQPTGQQQHLSGSSSSQMISPTTAMMRNSGIRMMTTRHLKNPPRQSQQPILASGDAAARQQNCTQETADKQTHMGVAVAARQRIPLEGQWGGPGGWRYHAGERVQALCVKHMFSLRTLLCTGQNVSDTTLPEHTRLYPLPTAHALPITSMQKSQACPRQLLSMLKITRRPLAAHPIQRC